LDRPTTLSNVNATMSSSTVIPTDSTTLHDVVQTLSRSSEEKKSARTPTGTEREGDEFIAVEAEDPDLHLEYPDGGWQAWGVVVGVGWFLSVDRMCV
jgi:hypothetical protein